MKQTPKAQLRPIAVTVVATDRSRFNWRLLEQDIGDAWRVVAEGPKSEARYDDAMAAGLRHLETLVADLERGPVHGASTSAGRPHASATPPARPPASEHEAEEAIADAPRRSAGKLFGFGPLR